MLISVVMSVFNDEKYIREAIESVLMQTYKDFEFIIVDDGSIDKSADIIKSYKDSRIQFLQQSNNGTASALNAGIRISKGKYIARIDADDICLPERFQKQLDYIEDAPNCAAVGSAAEIIDKNGRYLYTYYPPSDKNVIKSMLPNSPFFHSSVLFRKEIAEKCNFYNEKLYLSQDGVLFTQMAQYGELHNLPEILIKYRISPGALTTISKKLTARKNEIIKKAVVNGDISDNDALQLKNLRRKQSKRFRLGNYYYRVGSIYLTNNFKRKRAVINYSLSLAFCPENIKAWFYLLLSLFPKSIINAVQNRKR